MSQAAPNGLSGQAVVDPLPDSGHEAVRALLTGDLVRRCLPLLAVATLVAAIWTLPENLSQDGRIALIVLVLAIAGWTMTKIGDTAVALAAAIVLTGTGVISNKELFASLGDDLIWLIIAAFVMSAVLRTSGLVERFILGTARNISTVRELFYVLALLIASTALVIPSTSGRAALMLPVFLALARLIRNPAVVRALALLFPTVILLSACGSLIGAGAHLVAADMIERAGGGRIDYASWLALNMPFAILSSIAATTLILKLFLNPALAARRIELGPVPSEPLTTRQIAIAAGLVATVVLWLTTNLHGLSIALVALTGAVVMLQTAGPLLKSKEAFKSVEVELVVFLAATFVLADALAASGADKWLAGALLLSLPAEVAGNLTMVVLIVALVSLSAHLVITSRTARVTVLIPAFTLPLAGLGHDPTLLIMLTVVGTGFCQTMTVSAKPVALYSRVEVPTYTGRDLMRLSVALFPVMLALLLLFACFVWPSR